MFGMKKKEQPVNIKKPVNKVEPVKKPKIEKPKKVKKTESRWEFYDNILTAVLQNKIPREPQIELNIDQVSLDWGTLISHKKINAFFIVENYQNWVPLDLFTRLRNFTLENVYDVSMNYYMTIKPHSIDWNSPKMRQYVRVNKYRIENDTVDRDNVFTNRENFQETQMLQSKMNNLRYFDSVDLTYHRSIFRTSMFIQIQGSRNNFPAFIRAIEQFQKGCAAVHVTAVKLNADVFDWFRRYLPTSLRENVNVDKKTSIQVMSDDTISALHSGMQGIIGQKGIVLGTDVYSCLPVLHTFREEKNKAENILITAQTGGGKSVFVKNLLYSLVGFGYKLCILDYEGDEYNSIVTVMNHDKPGSAIKIDMAAGNGNYFDPLCISSLQISDEEDLSAKAEAIKFTKAMFNIIFQGKMTIKQEDILSDVIARVYAEKIITDNPKTWRRSKKLRLHMVYDTLKRMYELRKPFIDASGDNSRQIEARDMLLRLKKFFVPGESDYGTFTTALDSEKLWKADCVVFSFGNKGQSNVGADNIKLALKQLCVSKVSNDFSNYNKFVENKFTVKVWEEVQRFLDVPGAGEIMKNCITGGRKRGDIALVVTNNLAEILNAQQTNATPEKLACLQALKDNLQGMCVGYIKTESTRAQFCEEFNMQLFKDDLDKIAEETGDVVNKDESGAVIESPFKSSFLVKMDAQGSSPAIQTIVKATIHPSLFENNIFSTGPVNLERQQEEF